MKKLFLLLLITSCGSVKNLDSEKATINTVLNSWHKNASETKFEAYFGAMTNDAIFIGTDATENWNKEAFMKFSKPYFDKGKAWNFTAIERNVYINKDGKTAWFDELLNTQMKICRGSGVLIKVGNDWKIQHYVLSMTIPNDNSDAVVKIKTPIEDVLIEKLSR
jgi:ketosteroid isomerase-like protein